MRLWHYKLIPVLPDKMLIAQWRECVAIKRQWGKGTLIHPLVRYVMNYDRIYFLRYVDLILEEMKHRNIEYNFDLYKEIYDFCENINSSNNYPEHNDRYLNQCCFNLQEKYDRGIITEEEYDRIKGIFGSIKLTGLLYP